MLTLKADSFETRKQLLGTMAPVANYLSKDNIDFFVEQLKRLGVRRILHIDEGRLYLGLGSGIDHGLDVAHSLDLEARVVVEESGIHEALTENIHFNSERPRCFCFSIDCKKPPILCSKNFQN